MIPQTAITGQKGVNLIERIVLDMGCVWIPRTQFDAGIDGYIEFRDESTGTMSGNHVAVQSKCGDSYFKSETHNEFSYQPDPRDLEYWARANLPVLVIVSRTSPEESFCFWSPKPSSDQAKAIKVDKSKQRFDRSARQALLLEAAPVGNGFYFSLPHKEEAVWTNLLELVRYPVHVFTGTPASRNREEIYEWINEHANGKGNEIVVRGDYLLSVHDLSGLEWKGLVETGTVESHAGSDWASSDDPETSRRFVELLNKNLRDLLYARGMKFWTEGGYFYFRKPRESNDLKIFYRRSGRRSGLTVVHGVIKEFEGRQFHSYRHMALTVRWIRLAMKWYAALTPAWHYTLDGEKLDPRHEDWLSGLRKLEKNNTVTSQVLFFADYLGEGTGMFNQSHAWLGFGDLLSETLPVTIPDDEWITSQEAIAIDPNAEPEGEDVVTDLFDSGWEDEE